MPRLALTFRPGSVIASQASANTMLYVAGLIGDGFLVEIEAQTVVLA